MIVRKCSQGHHIRLHRNTTKGAKRTKTYKDGTVETLTYPTSGYEYFVEVDGEVVKRSNTFKNAEIYYVDECAKKYDNGHGRLTIGEHHIVNGVATSQSDYPTESNTVAEIKKFYDIRDFCNMDYSMVAVLKQEPGNFTGWHFDTYHSVATKGNLTEEQKKDIKRYWIPLEDWHWGHFIQVGNSVLTHWKAGEIYTWNYGMYHLGANAGIKTRWSCQVTGYSTEESLHNLNEFEFKLRG